MQKKSELKILVIAPSWGTYSETFIREHVFRLPGEIDVLYDFSHRPKTLHYCSATSSVSRITIKFGGLILGKEWKSNQKNRLIFKSCTQLIQQIDPDVILFEYGTTASYFVPFLARNSIPFVVHFHGYDASVKRTIQDNFHNYLWLFQNAHAIVVVSQQMRNKFISWGVQEEKVHYNPCGVDTTKFSSSNGYLHSPNFLAVGRFVEKKAPHLLVHSFAKVLQAVPQSRLAMIGEGELLPATQSLADDLGITEKIEFKKSLSHEDVCKMMQQAGCFVQHSVRAKNGDSEGTPVAIMEAMTMGLPVVTTAHAGINDIIENEKTGLLVNEHDIDGMAQAMIRIVNEPALAKRLGYEARNFAIQNLEISKSIENLFHILTDHNSNNI